MLPAAILPLTAATINVTGATTAALATGNTLEFTLAAYSFADNAGQFGLSPDPARVTFEFLSAPETGEGQFLAELTSRDGSVSVDFSSPFTWQQGWFQGGGYTGPVSLLYGSINLSSALSSQLFSSGAAVLVLQNVGPEVTVGLPPYRLGQDLDVSLSTGGFGVSAPVTQVLLDPPDPPSSVPEPGSGILLLAAGAALCMAPGIVKRISHRNIQ